MYVCMYVYMYVCVLAVDNGWRRGDGWVAEVQDQTVQLFLQTFHQVVHSSRHLHNFMYVCTYVCRYRKNMYLSTYIHTYIHTRIPVVQYARPLSLVVHSAP